jgi:hypothetical protein
MKAYEVEERFIIDGFTFEIIPQSNEEYAIRVKHVSKEAQWITHPDNRYETLGGCYLAILMFLEENTQ